MASALFSQVVSESNSTQLSSNVAAGSSSVSNKDNRDFNLIKRTMPSTVSGKSLPKANDSRSIDSNLEHSRSSSGGGSATVTNLTKVRGEFSRLPVTPGDGFNERAQSSSVFACPFGMISKENGVKIRSIQEISIEKYVTAVSEVVDPSHILAASRMKSGVVIFFNSTDDVNKLCTEGLAVEHHFFEVQCLVKIPKKITLSNVPPYLPTHVLEEELEEYGRIVSRISPIPLGIKNPALKHIKSFRRQTSMLLKDNLPSYIDVSFQNQRLRIFINDDVVCFKCKKEGHIQKKCPLNKPPANNETAALAAKDSNVQYSAEPVHQQTEVSEETESQTESDSLLNQKSSSVEASKSSPFSETISEAPVQSVRTSIQVANGAHVPSESISEAPSVASGDKVVVDVHMPEVDSDTVVPSIKTSLKRKCNTEEAILPKTIKIPESIDVPRKSSDNIGNVWDLPPASQSTQESTVDDQDVDIESVASDVSESLSQITDIENKLTPEQLENLLQELKGSKKPMEVCLDYTPNIKQLCQDFIDMRRNPETTTPLKARLNKLIKKCKGYLKSHV